MAKVDVTDTSFYMNPAAYTHVKDEKKPKGVRRGEKTEFSHLFDNLRAKTADELGPLQNLSASDEAVDMLMDEVRDAGDILKDRPYAGEIMRYKQAVRNFINYVVQNCYSKDDEEGLPNKLKPSFRGRRTGPQAMDANHYVKIQVIDKKLEDLAAMLLSSQRRQMELVSRLEELKGLLIDLLQ
ncbi:MAG: YaaR family protein [Treponema sp.]|jgi:uncharacterized protein YaaR (DUF327 family)|nr:YaaR family protein [Treponema sp.]